MRAPVVVLLAAVFWCNEFVNAQVPATDIDKVQRLTEYLNITATATDLMQLVDWQHAVESKSATEQARVQAFQQLLFRYARLLNTDTTGLNKSIQSWATRQTVKHNLRVFEDLDYAATPNGQLAEVKKFGTGSIPVILIPEYRKNWSIFNDLIQANLDRYTFYAITLPGYNGSRPYALPAHYDFSNRVWLDNVVTGVVALIKNEKLKKPVIVGALNAGSYIATNVALRLGNSLRGIILLNGAIWEELDSKPDPLPLAQRAKELN